MPRKPLELKRRLGNPGKRALPKPATLVVLPMAAGVPDPPSELGVAGGRLWARAWSQALTWLSPISDWTATLEACRLADDLEVARNRYRATSDPRDGRAVVALSKRLSECLSALGFTPSDRSRLGLAEVKAATKLEQLAARRKPGRA